MTELTRALQSSPDDSNAVRLAWDNAQSLIIEKCVTPLVEQADKSADITARNLYLGAAMACQEMHSQGCGLLAKTVCKMRELGPDRFAMLPEKELRQQASLASTLFKFLDAIEKNRKASDSTWDW